MRQAPMIVAAAGMILAVSGCGSTDTSRAATGGLSGATAGAVVGGPVGAVIGGTAGAAGGASLNQGVDKTAEQKYQQWKTGEGSGNTAGANRTMTSTGQNGSGSRSPLSPQRVRDVQQALNQQENGRDIAVDGIWGPNTRQALRRFQRDHNMKATGQLDAETVQALNLDTGDMNNSGTNNSGTNNSGMNNGANARSGSGGTGGATSGTGRSGTTPQNGATPNSNSPNSNSMNSNGMNSNATGNSGQNGTPSQQ